MQAAELISQELGQFADPKIAASTQRFFTAPIQALGIDAPTQQRISWTWIQRLKAGWQLADAVALCDRLLQRPHMEVRGAGILILAGFDKSFSRELFFQAESWLERYLDNWALVDGFATAVLSPLLRLFPELADNLPRWTRSPSLWVRRASVVCLVPLARHGERLDLTMRLAESLLSDKEDLIHKAVGWVLREAGKADMARLKAFLLRYRATIPRTTVRYALERFPPAERQEWLELTRKPPAAKHHATARAKAQRR